MAYVSNMDQDEDQKNTAQGPVSPSGGGQTVHLAPSSGVTTGAGSPSTGAPAGAGGNFASLQNYVDANQGGAAPLANQITQGVQQQYNTLQGQNASTLSGIQNNVNSGYTAQDPSVLSQEAANPVSFASNPSNIASFQKQLNDQYTGPQSAESDAGYQNQLAADNQAITTGQNLTGSEAGRQQLLSQFEAAPSTSVTGLNSAILSQDPNSLNSIENAYQPFSNLTTQLSTGAQGIDQNIASAQTDAQAANTAANKQISDQVNGLNTGIQNTVAQDEAARQAYNADLQKYQSTYNPISTSINSLNETFKNAPVQTDWGGNYGQITNPFASALSEQVNNNVATANTVATPEQYQQAQAFQNLLNGINTGLPTPILDQSTAGQAGTYTAQTPFSGPQGAVVDQQVADAMNKAIDPNGPGPVSTNQQQAAFTNQYMPTFTNLVQQLKDLDPGLTGQ